MKVVDTNVLLYAVNTDSSRHHAAGCWLNSALSEPEPVGFCWLVLIGFVRLSTHAGIFARPLRCVEAFELVERWLARPNAVTVEPTDRHAAVLRGILGSLGTAGNLVNDAHIAALAVEHGAEVVSFDNDFDRFEGVHRLEPADAG